MVVSLTLSLHRGAQQTPDATYSICGDRVLSFTETIERVSRLAGGLRKLGVRGDDRVAILALNSDAYLQAAYAIAWADAVLVPVNTRWSLPEIADSLAEAEVRAIIVDDAFAERGARLAAEVTTIVAVIHEGSPAHSDAVPFEELASDGPRIADAHRSGESLAGIFYTGGTTGRSRGAMLSHRALVASATAFASMQAIEPDSRSLIVAPMFHLAQFSGWVAASLAGGQHVVLPAFDPAAILRQVERHRVNRAVLVPTMLHALINHPEVETHDLSSLRTIVYGGSPISRSTLQRTLEVLPGAEFTQVYGMTEMAAVVTVLTPRDHDDAGLLAAAGRSAPHALVRVADPDTGADQAAGVVGEIVVRGDGMMSGYWRRPEETKAVMGDGWVHTGDAGYLDERGFLFIVDRVKDMIVSGGENVYSIEVEKVVDKHPAVAQSAVIGVPDDQWGERVHAVVVPRAGATLDLEELRRHCRAEIAGYKCPRSLTIVDALPTSPAGKILKRELRNQLGAAL
jgi:acyl-CoA synthetase (AMP-forming)/AMP-acid ligase II